MSATQKEPSYFKRLFRRTVTETWDAVFANRPGTIFLAFLAACIAIYLQRRYGGQTHAQMVEAFISILYGLAAYAVVFVIVFLWNFLYATPKKFCAQSEANCAELRVKLTHQENDERVETFKLNQEIKKLEGDLQNSSENRRWVEKLARAVDEGCALAERYRSGNPSSYPQDEDKKKWIYTTVNPVLDKLGNVAKTLFNASAESAIVPPIGVPESVAADYCWIMARVRSLEKFITQIMRL